MEKWKEMQLNYYPNDQLLEILSTVPEHTIAKITNKLDIC